MYLAACTKMAYSPRGRGRGHGWGGCGRDSSSAFSALTNFVLGLRCAAGKKSTVSMNCAKEREGGNLRMISQFLFLKGTLVAAFSPQPNVLCPVGLKHILSGLAEHGKIKEFS